MDYGFRTVTNPPNVMNILQDHAHDYIIKDSNVRYRDENGEEFILDTYICECGAGGIVKTPKELFDKGIKVLGITEQPSKEWTWKMTDS